VTQRNAVLPAAGSTGTTGGQVVYVAADLATVTARQSRTRAEVVFDEVLSSARAGHPWAFERIFTDHSRPVAAYLRSQSAVDPDGMTNDVFLRAFRGLDRFEGGEAQLRAWLFTIARNLFIDERRRAKRRPVTESMPDAPITGDHEPASEQLAMSRMGSLDAVALIEQLVTDQREVLLLRIVGDLTIEQIAGIVGKRPGAVKALQRRGLAAIRRRLGLDVPFGPVGALDITDDGAATPLPT
jgi:RNA polymerase sigma factor (sigma-70 family)